LGGPHNWHRRTREGSNRHGQTQEVQPRRGPNRVGKPCLVRVDAPSAHADGVAFFKANFTFWLAMTVLPKYLSVDGTS
jgi:RNA:NAD 2'-phosphotransferase (TPT1/KptA family)